MVASIRELDRRSLNLLESVAARGERELGFLTLSESHLGPYYLGLQFWVCCRLSLGL
ncbi:Dicer-like protein 1 [Gossypium arboreum]|uniref:Dicer-like protein 1 n=1 Tax=Gossypium arboreum TaxID=29729 RepID=A0A0B0N1B9_GOSAR|nr:Dicer-like protein 1 [Gossypium arboreum]